MKALTICQPYAHLIVIGEKLVENREWPTRYRGPLAIHAGRSRAWLSPDIEDKFRDSGDPLIFGAIVGTVILADVLHIERIKWGDYDERYPWLRNHEHANGTWCWVLQDVQRYAQPVPWKGAQGLWDFPDGALTPNANVTGLAPRRDER